MSTLQVENAVKCYGDRLALNDVTIAVAPGECVALLGHNGAGKSTLIKSVLGLIGIDGGRISILGSAPGSAAARRRVAYLPESTAFHPLLSGREQLKAFARLRGEPAKVADELLERVGLAADGHRRIGTYSKGMRQRLGLAQVLIGSPDLVLLDEPTSGLDPSARWEFYEIVKELSVRGAAVLLSSHALTEIEAHTDRILMLRHGELVAQGTIDALRSHASLPVRVRVTGRTDDQNALVERLGGTRVNGRAIELVCAPADKMACLASVAKHPDIVADVELRMPSLDDLYRHFSHEGA